MNYEKTLRVCKLKNAVLLYLLLVNCVFAADSEKPDKSSPLGIFGEYTLIGGEQVLGVYHPEQSTLEVYGPVNKRTVKPKDILIRRRLSVEPEAEPINIDTGEARETTLAYLTLDTQGDIKRIENRQSELQKHRQSKLLEISKREEENKDAEEAMVNEKDPQRKVTYAALATEHLKAIAAANVAIVEADAEIAVNQVRYQVKMDDHRDLQSRLGWLRGRLNTMKREQTGK